MLDTVVLTLANSWNYRVHKDTRTWRSHLDSLHANWTPILPLLADAFLHWKASNSAPPLTTPLSTEHGFTIEVVDLFTLESHAFIPREDDILTSVALVNAGYVGHVPHTPSLVFSLRTLEHYRLVRSRKPSFSVEAFSKVICDSYKVCSPSFLSH